MGSGSSSQKRTKTATKTAASTPGTSVAHTIHAAKPNDTTHSSSTSNILDEGAADTAAAEVAAKDRDAACTRAASLSRQATIRITGGRTSAGVADSHSGPEELDALVERWLGSMPRMVVWDWDRTVVSCHTFREGVKVEEVRALHSEGASCMCNVNMCVSL